MGTITGLQQRWDVFLAKIAGTFAESVQEAETALITLMEEDPTDPQPILVAWAGIRSQLIHLIAKIGNTWQDSVSPQMAAHGYKAPGYDWTDESAKGTHREEHLHRELERAEIRIMGRCAELCYRRTLDAARLHFACRQCASPIHVAQNLFRAHYENCTYCNTVNTYEPSTALRTIEWFAVDHLAAYRCLPQYERLLALQNALSRTRHGQATAAQLAEVREAYMTYWQNYLAQRISMVPALEETYAADLERRRREVNELMNRYS